MYVDICIYDNIDINQLLIDLLIHSGTVSYAQTYIHILIDIVNTITLISTNYLFTGLCWYIGSYVDLYIHMCRYVYIQ